MLENSVEKTLSRLLLVGAPLTTLFLVSGTVTDPVNLTKLVIAGGFGFGLLGLFLVYGRGIVWREARVPLLVLIVFNIATLNASIQSESPLSQNFFGAYGRNSGFITYLCFSFIFIGALMMRRTETFQVLVYGFLFAGIVNVLYSAWVLMFGDFIGWSNPYGNILGLFGNPNFIGAFLGMLVAGCAALWFKPQQETWIRVALMVLSVIAALEIRESHAIQGIVVSAAGVIMVLFFWVKSRFKSNWVLAAFSGVSFVVGIMAIMGTLQKGPFSFVYKRSVSLRGTYWETAIEMGNSRPFSGVGMDAYGDWYRRARPPVALVDTPGIGITSNAAHNVVLDFFAFGGWPLFIAYIVLITLTLISIVRLAIRNKKYDATFVFLATLWLCYELQSLISINQIGLAVWGWVLGGAIISYDIATSPKYLDRKVTSAQKSVVSAGLVAGVSVVIGLIVAYPPMNSDSKFKSALDSRQIQLVEAALTPTFYTISDSYRYALAVDSFAKSNLPDQALKYARICTEFNPDYYTCWQLLYSLNNSSQEEKTTAVANLRRLDPLNPDVTKF